MTVGLLDRNGDGFAGVLGFGTVIPCRDKSTRVTPNIRLTVDSSQGMGAVRARRARRLGI